MPVAAVTAASTPAATVPVDAHVHFHRLEGVGPTVDAAARNFTDIAPASAAGLGVLLLTETPTERVFERLAEARQVGRWQVSREAGEPESLWLSSGAQRILVVCGRQISCADRLEVLALGTTSRYPQGEDLDQTIGRVRADGHIAVVPWGFLKWRGSRGDRIRALMAGRQRQNLYFGDNGGRMEALEMPRLLKDAAHAGFRILPGTDPFPFGRDYRRVGAFGFLADMDLDPDAPWAALRRWLEDGTSQPRPYGRALGPLRFAYNQGWIQVHNRMLHRTAG